MTTAQAPAILPVTTILPKLYSHFEHLMDHGCLLWTREGLTNVYGMVSHHIADMQDRDVLMRRRGSSSKSRCDGMLWTGCYDGVKWPPNCDNLLQLHTIVPGPYLLRVKQFLDNKFNNDKNKRDKIGKQITLTTQDSDVFNNLEIDTTIKAPLEINHTAMLGLLVTAFEIEWTKLHNSQSFDEISTRGAMTAYLNKYWDGINGVRSLVAHKYGNFLKFSMINHSWQTMVEIMLSLPHVVDWNGNVNLLCNLIRMTGCLHTCVTENRRKQLQPIMKRILSESFVVFWCFFIMLL